MSLWCGALALCCDRQVDPVAAIIAEVNEISTVQQLALLASIDDLAFDKPPTAGRKLFCQAAINEARKRHNMSPVSTAAAAAQSPPESTAAVNAAYALPLAFAGLCVFYRASLGWRTETPCKYCRDGDRA